MNRRLKILIIGAGIFIIPVLVSPLPNFKAPLSTVVEARDGSLFGARIAADGQWRFPASGKVPEKFKKALLTFEDRYFFYHPVDIISDECFQTKYLIWSFKQAQYSCGDSVYYLRNGRLSAVRLFPGPCLPKIFPIWAGLPTAIFTFGVLLIINKKIPGYYLIISAIFAADGFLAVYKGVFEDLGLNIAGLTGTYLLLRR